MTRVSPTWTQPPRVADDTSQRGQEGTQQRGPAVKLDEDREPIMTSPARARGAMLRAYDKTSGREVGAVYMPAQQSGTPMTYALGARQFIVVPISGANYSGEYLAFALPR